MKKKDMLGAEALEDLKKPERVKAIKKEHYLE